MTINELTKINKFLTRIRNKTNLSTEQGKEDIKICLECMDIVIREIKAQSSSIEKYKSPFGN